MKTLALITTLLLTFQSFGKDRIAPYWVQYEEDSTVLPGTGRLLFSCQNVVSTMGMDIPLAYGMNGSSEVGMLDLNRMFTRATEPGKYVFQFYVDNCREIYTDSIEVKPGVLTVINLFFEQTDERFFAEKPVIYVYPETDLNLLATVTPKGNFTFTYPEYGNGWQGTAHPDGSMTVNGKTYPYLFWEAAMTTGSETVQPGTGFVLQREQVVAFLEKQLAAIGLNAREQADFITYWGPRLVQHEQVALQFAWGTSCDRFASLQFQPQPDHINRLYIIWSPATDHDYQLIPQELPVFDRSGFDVLEWGGIEVPAMFHTVIAQQ